MYKEYPNWRVHDKLIEEDFPDEDAEIDVYLWALSDKQPDLTGESYRPDRLCSPIFVGPVMDSDPVERAAEWLDQHRALLLLGPFLWAHLGRGWMLLGRNSEEINKHMGPFTPARDALRKRGM